MIGVDSKMICSTSFDRNNNLLRSEFQNSKNNNLLRFCYAGQVLEVVLAKPQSDKKPDGAYSHISGSHPNHLLHAGYGSYGGSPYGSLGGYGVTAGLHQVICSFITGTERNEMKQDFGHINLMDFLA